MNDASMSICVNSGCRSARRSSSRKQRAIWKYRSKPDDHEQLLVELRRLRQRVELAGMHAARHEVVARAFGRRLREDRRLDLEEAALVEEASRRLLKAVAQNQILLQLGATQVEIPMLETQLLGGELLSPSARDRNRRRLGGSDDPEIAAPSLRRRPSPSPRFASRADARRPRLRSITTVSRPSLPRALDDVGRRPARIERDLHDAGAIAEVEKNESAEVSRAVHPAAESDFGADVGGSELAGQMRSLGRRKTGGRRCGGQRRAEWVE